MKKGIIAAVVVVVLAVAGYAAYIKFGVKPLIPKEQFGSETIAKISKDNFNVACGDAKNLVVMIDAINKDFAEHPELGGNATGDNMTPAMKNFETSMDALGGALEKKFINDNKTKESAFNGIGEGVAKIFQIAVYKHLGMVTNDNVTEFIDITFCGKTPQADYKSPLDLNVNSLPTGNGGNEEGDMIEKEMEDAPKTDNEKATPAQ